MPSKINSVNCSSFHYKTNDWGGGGESRTFRPYSPKELLVLVYQRMEKGIVMIFCVSVNFLISFNELQQFVHFFAGFGLKAKKAGNFWREY